ncbi:hypothetical protein K8R32_01015 [bacterium]|nr:hypothetical protein [bacterium]
MKKNWHSKWVKWKNRDTLENLNYPGVYCLAISKINLERDEFDWIKKIKYIGMTNSRAGLKGRLKQFDNTIIGKKGHGGADRFRYKHQDYSELSSVLYLSVCYFKCDVKSIKPIDLRIMGDVAKYEYECFSKYSELFHELPEFNNKSESKKYSLPFGRMK